MIQEVRKYFDDILIPQLTRIGASDSYKGVITDAVYKQMYSVLVNWDDVEFINSLFLTVSEEAPFYKPDAKPETKSFIALTLRNSPIESLQSDAFQSAGITKKISDVQLIEITSAAIEYFDKLDLPSLADDEEYILEDDVYYVLSEEYPIAWNVLKSVANNPSQGSRFESFVYETPPEHLVLDKILRKTDEIKQSVVDGYDPCLDEALVTQLNYIIEGKGSFAIDCFKMLSRNMKKILLVIEILMQNQCRFVTANYYIENGYYEKRIPTLRAASSASGLDDMKKHYNDFTGVLPRHEKFLQAAFKD